MQSSPFLKSTRFVFLAVLLTAFLAPAFSPGPADAAGVGFMKRGGERNSSSSDKSDKASSSSSKSVERSVPARSSEQNAPRISSPSNPGSSQSMRPSRSNSDNVRNMPNRNDFNNRPQRDTSVDQSPVFRPRRTDNPAPVTRTPEVTVPRETRREVSTVKPDERRSTIGSVLQRGKSPSTERSETISPPAKNTSRLPERTAQRSDDTVKRTDQRPQRSDTVIRPDQRPQRGDTVTRSDQRPQRSDTTITRTPATRSGSAGPWSWNRGRDSGKVVERVFETRRNWQHNYRNYDHRWRPTHRDGFYWYRGHIGFDRYHYGHYSFSFVPRYTYPSIYFHYGAFPYIYSNRVVVLVRPARHYVYVPIYWDDDYYLNRSYYYPYDGYYFSSSIRRSLRSALNDIEESWKESDPDLLMRYVARGKKIDVFSKGSYEYSIDREDFRDMTLDAMETIDTVDFEFYNVKLRAPDEAVAYGKHTYYRADDDYTTIYVKYALDRSFGDWYITEVGSSTRRLD